MASEPGLPMEFAGAFRRFLEVVAAAPQQSPLLDRLGEHLGGDPRRLPIVGEEFDPIDQANVQLALERLTSGGGRRSELVGFGAENKRMMAFGLSDLMGRGGLLAGPPREGPVDYVNVHLDGGRVLGCIRVGFYLLQDGDARLVVFVSEPSEMGPRSTLRVEAMSIRREEADRFLAELVRTVEEVNVFRGRVVSLEVAQSMMGPPTAHAVFHTVPAVERDEIVLPPGVLERVEQETVVFARHAQQLRALGRSLKRGLLLHGLPGTGKTYTIGYLCGQMPDRTVVIISGRALGMVATAVRMARTLAPAMVVLEDCDLIAQERMLPMQQGPLLFELLNEMEGLADDADVIFLLTTNRPELLEPALAARPGRIDLAVELPLPDVDGRRRLIEIYARGLQLDGVDTAQVAESLDGATPAYVKEFLRKSALVAVAAGSAAIRPEHVEAARAELAAGGRLAEQLVGFRPEHHTELSRPTGFPRPETG